MYHVLEVDRLLTAVKHRRSELRIIVEGFRCRSVGIFGFVLVTPVR